MLLRRRPIPSTRPSKYIIQLGGVRTPAQFLAKAAEIQSSYFHGGAMRLQYDRPGVGLQNLDQQVSASYAIPYDLLEPSLATTLQIPFTNWTENFLLLNIARPGTANMLVDADREAFINNIRVAARAAYRAGFRGVVFDMEAYDSSAFWNYPAQPAGPTFPQRQASYVSAGSIAINVVEQEFRYRSADIIIAISYEQLKDIANTAQLQAYRYGLLPSFLDGMHDNATTSRLTCMCEEAYVNTTAADFDHDIELQTPPTVPWLNSLNYSKVHLNGLSTWLDASPPTFNFDFPAANYFTPAGFQDALDLMIPRVDKYVVVYTNSSCRWPGMVPDAPTTDRQVPYDYVQVLNNMIYSSSAGWMLG